MGFNTTTCPLSLIPFSSLRRDSGRHVSGNVVPDIFRRDFCEPCNGKFILVEVGAELVRVQPQQRVRGTLDICLPDISHFNHSCI